MRTGAPSLDLTAAASTGSRRDPIAVFILCTFHVTLSLTGPGSCRTGHQTESPRLTRDDNNGAGRRAPSLSGVGQIGTSPAVAPSRTATFPEPSTTCEARIGVPHFIGSMQAVDSTTAARIRDKAPVPGCNPPGPPNYRWTASISSARCFLANEEASLNPCLIPVANSPTIVGSSPLERQLLHRGCLEK